MPEIKQKSNIAYNCTGCEVTNIPKEYLAKIIISNDVQFCSMNCYANWRVTNK